MTHKTQERPSLGIDDASFIEELALSRIAGPRASHFGNDYSKDSIALTLRASKSSTVSQASIAAKAAVFAV